MFYRTCAACFEDFFLVSFRNCFGLGMTVAEYVELDLYSRVLRGRVVISFRRVIRRSGGAENSLFMD
jgi:hypothetical protein